MVAVTCEPVERGTWTVGRGQAVTAAAPRVQSCVCRNNAYRRGAGGGGLRCRIQQIHTKHICTRDTLFENANNSTLTSHNKQAQKQSTGDI